MFTVYIAIDTSLYSYALLIDHLLPLISSLCLSYNLSQASDHNNSTANCGPQSEITLSGNLYNFHILSLNNLTNPFTNVSFVVSTKCAIFYNLSYTTNITSFSATNGNLVIKSTIKYVYSFSSTLLSTSY